MSREDILLSVKWCSVFGCLLTVTMISPFLIHFIRVEYEFSNFNFSRIICQLGNQIILKISENCSNTLKRALRANNGYERYGLKILIHSNAYDVPINFDARLKWPECPSINRIRDQGACGSCWAVSAASTIEDRLCIHSEGKIIVRLSEEDILSCCSRCGSGCEGGSPLEAWKYWKNHGVVTGYEYGILKGCKPYSIAPCVYFNATNYSRYQSTPLCSESCLPNYSKTYEEDLYFGKLIYSITSDENQIMKEIMTNGPVQAQMALYSDFVDYKSGIYVPSYGVSLVSQHSLKIIGWGTDSSTGIDYWLMANSFNTNWGESGFLRIKRGVGNSHSNIYAGIPEFERNRDLNFTSVTEERDLDSGFRFFKKFSKRNYVNGAGTISLLNFLAEMRA